MTRRRRFVASLWRGMLRSLVVWAIVAALMWLDSTGPHYGRHAAVFSFILTAINAVSSALGTVAGFIAASLEAVVAYLGAALAWLGRRVADILFSTGAIFARVWDGIKLLWKDVLQPMIKWIDAGLKRFESWLRKTFAPLFKYLKAFKTQFDALYLRFVQPVLDVIGFVKQLNHVLNLLHIHILDKLTEILTRIEQRIDDVVLWINGKLNEIVGWLNIIVTADGLFQRVTLLRSLERDLAHSWRMLVNARGGALTDAERAALRERTRGPSLVTMNQQFIEYATSNTGPFVDAVAAIQQAVDDSGLYPETVGR